MENNGKQSKQHPHTFYIPSESGGRLADEFTQKQTQLKEPIHSVNMNPSMNMAHFQQP